MAFTFEMLLTLSIMIFAIILLQDSLIMVY